MSDTDSINTFNSWATNLTTCEPIEKALSHLTGETKFKRKILEIVTSMKHTIVNKGGSETSTEFYATMIAFLKGTELDSETLDACFFILNHLMKQHIPIAVLRYTTSDLSKIILELLSTHSKNDSMVKSALFCLSKLIAVQPDENWKLDNITHLYRTLFSYTTNSRKKVNRTAGKCVYYIFSSKTKANGGPLSKKHPLNRETIAILTNSIRMQNLVNKKHDKLDLKVKPTPEDDILSFSLRTLSDLLKSKLFNTECIVVYLETLIQCLMSLQIVPIQCQILSIFSDLFIGRVMLPEQIARSLTSLFAYLSLCCGKSALGGNKSSSTAPPSFIGAAWLKTVLMGFESLLLTDQSTFVDSATGQTIDSRYVALTHATQLIKNCSDWLLCDGEELTKSAFSTMLKLCSCALSTSETRAIHFDVEQFPDTDNWLTKWSDILCRQLLLTQQHTTMWSQLIECLVHLTVQSNGKCERFIVSLGAVLPQLAELRDSYEDTEEEAIASLVNTKKIGRVRDSLTDSERLLKNSIESLLGTVIKTYGLEAIAHFLPLSDVVELSTRTWLIPLIKLYTENTALDRFRTLILPVIHTVTRQMDNLSDTASVAAITLGTLRYQLWSCLPSFARKIVPGGVREVLNQQIELSQQPIPFPPGVTPPSSTLFDLIMELLVAGSNLEVIALSTLRNIISTAQDRDEMLAVLTTAPLFPALVQRSFSLYLHQNQATQINIKSFLAVYLPLFDPATFDPNCTFLMQQKLAEIDTAAPTAITLLYIDLLLILGPHLTTSSITVVHEFLSRFLNTDSVSNQLQKRAYRFLALVTAADTDTSNEWTKQHRCALMDQLHAPECRSAVKADSWKCRMKTVHHVLKLMSDEPAEVTILLNGFLPEVISCLNVSNSTTRALSGLLLVEGILASGDGDGSQSIARSIDRMLQQILTCLRNSNVNDSNSNNTQSRQFRGALAKALYLILSENRLAPAVTRQHITDTLTAVADIFIAASAVVIDSDPSDNDSRHLVRCAIDTVYGLLKRRAANSDLIHLDDIGRCIAAASGALLKKVRMPMRRVLRAMLKRWDYEAVKRGLPADLVPVLRNIHKAANRAQRKAGANDDGEDDTQSFATSWGGASEAGSQRTMKNPYIKNIAELLHDTDSEDDDLKSSLTATTIGNKSIKSAKSMKSTVSRASELRKQRKRKIDHANASLFLEEKLDDIVDLSDPTSMVRHLRISDGRDRVADAAVADSTAPPTKKVDKRGFHFEEGRLVIGKIDERKPIEAAAVDANDGDDSENENYKSEKGRFQPVKKRARKEKPVGIEYRSRKKGVFGDMKHKDKPDPYAYIPLKNTEQCHSVMTKYEKQAKKAHRAAVLKSKLRKKRN